MGGNMTVREQVINLISEQLNVKLDEIKDSSELVGDLGADSLDAVEIVMEVEEAFEIEISDEDADKFKTVGDIVNYITRRIGE